jgi:general secretion pathway protein A
VYPKYFGLKEPSFSIAPDPHYLFLSEQHREALAHLLYGAGEHGGFVLLTGEVGTGKTTVCRAFLEQLPDAVDVALIVNPALTADELLRAICDEFRVPIPAGEHSIKRLVDGLNDYLLTAHAAGRRPVLMIDEAQNLRPKVMEQVRLLTNLETTKAKLLQIFLIGQPELRRMLERESLRQLNQRITARFHLRPLSAAETAAYIRHRVAVAGVDRPLFTAGALRRIHQVSGGVPRVINILCDRALLGACVTGANQVTTRVVVRAAGEVRGEGVRTAPPPAARPAIAAAAALALLLTAAWLIYGRVQGDPLDLIAAWLGASPWGVGTGPESAPGQPAARPGVGAPSLRVAGAADPADAAAAPTAAGSVGAAPGATALPVVPPPGSIPTPPGGDSRALPRVSLAGSTDAAVADALGLPEETALRVLLRRWGIAIQDLGSGDPCRQLAVLGLRCEREQGKLSHVRFYDRPVLLRVKDAGGDRRYAVLGALDESHATFDLPDGSERVPLAGIDALWSGDYTVVWQPPPTGASKIGPGAAEESIRWLRRLLAEVPASGLTDNGSGRFDAALTAGLRRFQAARGLAPDGIAGPRTLVQLENAVALPDMPHLMTPTLAAEAAAQGAAALAAGSAAVLPRVPATGAGLP